MDLTDPLRTAAEATQSAQAAELSQPIQIALFLGAMVLLVAALVSLTSFTRIVIVLSFVRRALTTQEIPPNPVLIGLSLFLTLFVMGPTIERVKTDAIAPYLQGDMEAVTAWNIGQQQLKAFMLKQTRKSDLNLFVDLARVQGLDTYEDTPMRVLIPAFIISELKTAFIMGFCIYIPFVLIDLVVSTVLMSLGMMMMPPMVISTPCKLMLFILVDGWLVISQALALSFD